MESKESVGMSYFAKKTARIKTLTRNIVLGGACPQGSFLVVGDITSP